MVNEDTVTVLTDHYALPLADLELLLRRDCVEATTTGVPLYGCYTKAVAVSITDTVITTQ